MPLEGLRAWIGEVERKLGMRTRVFLVLSTIALGGAGAAIYLAVDARESSVSESDVRALQERLETRIAETATPTAPEVPTMPEEPAPEPAPAPAPDTTPEPQPNQENDSGKGGGGDGASAPTAPGEGKLKELVEQAEQQGTPSSEDPSGE